MLKYKNILGGILQGLNVPINEDLRIAIIHKLTEGLEYREDAKYNRLTKGLAWHENEGCSACCVFHLVAGEDRKII